MLALVSNAPVRPQLQLMRDRNWLPEGLRAQMATWDPRSDLGRIVQDCLHFLPGPLAQELIDSAMRSLIVESSLALTVLRQGGGSEDLGIVSRKVVTTAGVNFLAGAFDAATNNIGLFKFHAIGTTNTAENVADTALVAEVETRATGSQAHSSNTYTTVGTVTASGTRAIVEHGVFSASSAGTLWDRSVFSVVNLSSGDSLQATYVLTCSAGG